MKHPRGKPRGIGPAQIEESIREKVYSLQAAGNPTR